MIRIEGKVSVETKGPVPVSSEDIPVRPGNQS